MSPARRRQFSLVSLAAAAVLVFTTGLAWACTTLTGAYLDEAQPSRAPAGSSVSVSGGNWNENESLDLNWHNASNEFVAELGQAQVDSNGYFSTTVTVPASANPGNYYIAAVQTVEGETTQKVTPFEIPEPESSSQPSDGDQQTSNDGPTHQSTTGGDGDSSTENSSSGDTSMTLSGGDSTSDSPQQEDSTTSQDSTQDSTQESSQETQTSQQESTQTQQPAQTEQTSQPAGTTDQQPAPADQTQDDQPPTQPAPAPADQPEPATQQPTTTQPAGQAQAAPAGQQQEEAAEPDQQPAPTSPAVGAATWRELSSFGAAQDQTAPQADSARQAAEQPTQADVSGQLWTGLSEGLSDQGGAASLNDVAPGQDPLSAARLGIQILAAGLLLLLGGFGVAAVRRRRATAPLDRD